MKRWIYIAVGILLSANLFAQDSLGVRKIGDIGDSWYNVVDMHIQEPYLYVLNWDDALVVFQLIENDEPKFVGRNMDLLGRSFKVFGSKAVVMVDSRRLRLADLSNPSAPRLTASFNAASGDGFSDFQIFDENYLAISTWHNGMRIYDLSNMSLPRLISTMQAFAQSEVDASGSILFLRKSDSLYTIDASIPGQPQVLGARFWQGENYVQGSLLHKVDNARESLITYSIVDPLNPIVLGDTLLIIHNWGHPGQVLKISVSDRLLAVFSGVSTDDNSYPDFVDLNIYGISDSGTAFAISDSSWDSYFGEVAVGDSTIVLRHGGLLAHATVKKYLGGLSFMPSFHAAPWGAPMRLCLSGDKLMSNRAGTGWNVFDVSQPDTPLWLGSGSLARVDVGFSEVYYSQIGSKWLAHFGTVETETIVLNNFQLVNVQNPLLPRAYEINGFDGNRPRAFAMRDSLILISSARGNWLDRAIIQNDSTIVFVDSVQFAPTGGSITNIFLQGSRAILSCDYSLHVINLAQNSMSYLGGIDSLSRSSLVAIDENTVCRAVYSSRWIQFFDISDPLNISFEGQIRLASVPNGLWFADGHVFYSNPSDGLSIERLMSFDSCLHVGHYNTNFRGEDVAVINDIAYLANSQDIFVLDVSQAIRLGIPATPQELAIQRTFDPDHLLLTWFPVTMDRMGAPITIDAYEIYSRYSSDEAWVNIGAPTPPTATEYTIDIPTGGNVFAEYQVRAVKH